MSRPRTSAEYGRRVPPTGRGGVVDAVEPGSPAARGGLRAGDLIITADGNRLRDVIDWQWFADGRAVELAVLPPDDVESRVILRRESGEPWGLTFSDAVFDGVRTCRNRCVFCFMTQLPRGMRKALYLRDDDFRLSFLQGNFVTLTNLADEDLERIAEQHLSPLYVSLHAVDPDVRARLVCAKEDSALKRFDELLDIGVDLHVQIVLVPGVNDGAVLQESLEWLAQREGALSVGIVPLGFTAHQRRFTASYESAPAAAGVITAVRPWQEAMQARDSCTWVYLADEFYLNAGLDLPPAQEYDEFPQYENGIGLARDFVDEFRSLAEEFASAIENLPEDLPVTVATGELFAPVLARELKAVDTGARVAVLGVRNDFFGGNVNVAGLLASTDLARDVAGTPANGVVLLPACIANADGVLLDDVPVAGLGTALGREVRLLSCDAGGLLSGLRAVADNPPSLKE